MLTKNVEAIVLAAGRGHRFGSNKMLTPIATSYGAIPLVCVSVQPWLAQFDRITLVVNPDYAALKVQLDHFLQHDAERIDLIVCQQADAGMGHSLAAGVTANATADAWLIGLADMPLLPQSVIAASLRALREGARITAANCHDQRGHPVGFSALYREQLMQLTGDHGGRNILGRDAEYIHHVMTDDEGVLFDIDRPIELTRLAANHAPLFDRLSEQIQK